MDTRWLGRTVVLLFLAACDSDGGGRGPAGPAGDNDRGTWDPQGKSDDAATCALGADGGPACNARAEAGCWCDVECPLWGDCCPDVESVCGLPGNPGDEGGSAGGKCSLDTDGPWSCSALTGATTNPDGTYYVTNFGCWVDEDGERHDDPHDNCIPACSLASIGCSNKSGPECERELNWYMAGSDRFGCGTKVLVTNPDNGKSAVVMAIDRGPNCSRENVVDHWVLDLSGRTIFYLFGEEKAVTERAEVQTMVMDDDTPLGPFDGVPTCSSGGDEPGAGGVGSVCFPGKDGSGNTCLEIVAAGASGYEYPPAYQGDASYRAPIAYLDLDAIPGDIWLAPNFQLYELAPRSRGRFAVVQPHAVERLQDLRDDLGPIVVDEGFVPPGHEPSEGPGGSSRHPYGDGFDLVAVYTSPGVLDARCTEAGGTAIEYDTHVHCDWGDAPLDPKFFGAALGSRRPSHIPFSGDLVEHDAEWTVEAQGFDEGAPRLRWTALDADGEPLATATGDTFRPPLGTSRLQVLVGGRVELEATLAVPRHVRDSP